MSIQASRSLLRRQLLGDVKRRVAREPYRCFSCTFPHAQQHTPPPKSPRDAPGTTHFGFETVAEAMKEQKVGAVFSSVASSYDTMNDLMSLGIHRLWKDHFVRNLNPGRNPLTAPSQSSLSSEQGWHILDIAGGTGDIAFRMLDHASTINNDAHTRVTVADINPHMLEEGKKRAIATPYARSPRLKFVEANAEKLDMIPDSSIDLYTVAFGIRNFTHKDAAIREAFRVLKPGGVFACLEFSKVNNSIFDAVYKRWSFGAIPLIGQVVAGDRDSYQYLVESIEKFPSQTEFRDMIKEAGFLVPGQGWEDLTGGIAAIHKGVKPVS
ncbi:ubiquinone biosynthesis methyltransferas-like protein coq5 [Lindgomyces ingoldianus]|uniref:Ubiquinone biosynthesis methyltransferas-like protein coq5 n=1 Tax=Lindgomyces ingoldianus TaxID=673940 RepID=A0ACB6QPK8_9PLEO|nr:ubiquinone biosynthesis methyltransferas-like protein coq5 [Lindgomyces ingoldianus]KAF2468503.1 ubiquinone biosynthesis methyltransferas-like protein coq5 [Lindgomyces ingoldianus]